MNTNICFDKGILGFEHCKNFKLSEIEGVEYFKILQSKEEEDFQMIVISPLEVKNQGFFIPDDYEVDIPDDTVKKLDIKSSKDVLILTTVTVNSDSSKTTTNLRAPIVINEKNNKAMQIVLNSEKYKIKHPLMKG